MNGAALLAFAGAALGGGLAVLLLWRERSSLGRHACALGLLVLSLESLFSGLSQLSNVPENLWLWQTLRLETLALAPGTWLLFSLSYARRENRAALGPRWLAVAAAFLAPVGLTVFCHRQLLLLPARSGVSAPWRLELDVAGLWLHFAFLLCAVLVLINLERVFRAVSGTVRWRIKYLVLGLGVLFAVRAFTSGNALLFGTLDLSLQAINSGTLILAALLIAGSLWRGGGLELAVYPAPAPLLKSLTLIPSGVFLLMLGVLGKVLAHFRGQDNFVLEAMLAVTGLVLLTLLLLSEEMRAGTRSFARRYLRRPQYDYLGVWRAFTEGTTRYLEPAELSLAIARSVSELFQALSVTLWLTDEPGEHLCFAGSTALSYPAENRLPLPPEEVARVLAALGEWAEPADLDASEASWAVALRGLHPAALPHGGHRVAVPLLFRGELMGVMVLGDRVGGAPYTLQELDLLKAISGQAAASLLHLQFTQKLTQAKQLEAFEAMCAFFVHDLKNTASSLSLMLQNLPTHFHNPAFREEALSGVAQAVNHLNELVGRLHRLRQQFVLHAEVADLNRLVAETLAELAAVEKGKLVQRLQPVPMVRADPAQLRTVLTNLVLNAREAVNGSGLIHVETSLCRGWAVVAVSDNGPGMSQEFVQRSLFRPFHTTKANGLGIGLFQSKMIVEAHHGRLEVQSQPGQGTTFRVLLPLASPAPGADAPCASPEPAALQNNVELAPL